MADLRTTALAYDASLKACSAVLGDADGKACASIAIGGTDSSKFIPNINASKWNDAAWLNINHKATVVSKEKETFTDSSKEISMAVGDLTHKYYVDADGRLEYEIILAKCPESGSIVLDLSYPEGLVFHYQPALTQEDVEWGIERPENVIGSYAVYWSRRNNEFKTGKFCHIYRPKATDAEGSEFWLDQYIDPDAKTWAISLSKECIKKAVFPLIIDPTVGLDTQGATTFGHNTQYAVACFDTSTSAGTASKIKAYVKNGHSISVVNIKLAGYTDDAANTLPEDQLATEADIELEGSFDGLTEADYTPAISASTKYWLAWCMTGAGTTNVDKIYCDSVSGAAKVADLSGDLPANWGNTGAAFNYQISVWIDYAESGAAAASIIPIMNHLQKMRAN